MLLRLAAKGKYICQLELLGAIVAYTTFPDLLRRRLVHHFIDNQSAKGGLISGYSGKTDSALLIGLAYEEILRLGCYPWFSFVPSKDNISDDPSRNDFSRLRQLGAVFRRCVLPDTTVLQRILDMGRL